MRPNTDATHTQPNAAEPLEARRHLALTVTVSDTGLLYIGGTRLDDRIRIAPDTVDTTRLLISDDRGFTASVLLDTVTKVKIKGGDGPDDIQITVPDGRTWPVQLYGGDARDTLAATGGLGDNILLGQDGNDTLLNPGSRPTSIYGGAGDDIIDGTPSGGTSVGCTINAGVGNDTITGSPQGDLITGSLDADSINGAAGNDTIYGGSDTGGVGLSNYDTIFGGSGNDYIKGSNTGPSGSTLPGAVNGDSLFGGTGRDTIVGQGGNDTIYGNSDAGWTVPGQMDGDPPDIVPSLPGNSDTSGDRIDGGDGNDLILGSAGRDTFFGGAGSDTFGAGGGNDVVQGGDGNDSMYGGLGADSLFGEAGQDDLDAGSIPVPDDDPLPDGSADSVIGGASNDDFFNIGPEDTTDDNTSLMGNDNGDNSLQPTN